MIGSGHEIVQEQQSSDYCLFCDLCTDTRCCPAIVHPCSRYKPRLIPPVVQDILNAYRKDKRNVPST